MATRDERFDVEKSDEDWRRVLTPEQYAVLRRHGTEPPGSCALLHEHRAGSFSCAGCGQQLFVAEACSGLRSLTALLSLGVLIGGLWLRYPVTRIVLVLAAIPVAMVINAVRIFLTGFLVYHVSPDLGEGFMHMSEGWFLFVLAFAMLGALAWVFTRLEARVARRRARVEA